MFAAEFISSVRSHDGVPKLVRRPPDPSDEVVPTFTAWADGATSLLRMPEDLGTDVSAWTLGVVMDGTSDKPPLILTLLQPLSYQLL